MPLLGLLPASLPPWLAANRSAAAVALAPYARGAANPLGLVATPPPRLLLMRKAATAATAAAAAVAGTSGAAGITATSVVAPSAVESSALWPALGGDGGGAGGAGGVIELSIGAVAISSVLVGVAVCISLWLRLRIEAKLMVAAIRCVLQLTVLGYILGPIFGADSWWVVVAYSSFMLAVAAAEAAGRPQYSYKGLFLTALLALGGSASAVLTYVLCGVVRVEPWYDARYFIPLLGMLLGNAVSGVSVGLATVMEELSTGRDRVEILLALGATRMEALRGVVQRSMMVALTPLLNQMSVVGVVSIPGMMTGQILGGSDPGTAARYQIMIMFLVTASASISAAVAVLGTCLAVVDDRHRLRGERLVERHGKGGLNAAINTGFQWVIDVIARALRPAANGLAWITRTVAGAFRGGREGGGCRIGYRYERLPQSDGIGAATGSGGDGDGGEEGAEKDASEAMVQRWSGGNKAGNEAFAAGGNDGSGSSSSAVAGGGEVTGAEALPPLLLQAEGQTGGGHDGADPEGTDPEIGRALPGP